MVRCAKCGYLSRRNPHGKIVDVDEGPRQTGVSPWALFCLVQKADLRTEIKEKGPEVAICRDRECDGHTVWLQGLSPKDHRDMEIIREQQKLNQAQRENDRAWQEDRRREDRQNRKEDLEWQAQRATLGQKQWAREHRLQKHQLLIVGIVGTIVLAVTQIVAALLSK